jgi:hypothetical protein
MGKSILDPFYERLTEENVVKFGVCFDEYLQWRESPNHADRAKEFINIEPDLKTAFLAMFEEVFTFPRNITILLLKSFMKLSLDQMSLYITEFPNDIKGNSLCPPPIPGKGPLMWQVIMARWRLLSGF